MTALAFVFALVAVVLFCVAAFQVAAKINLVALGLAFAVLSWIFQLTVTGSLVHL